MEIRDFAGSWPGSRKLNPADMRGFVREIADGEYRVRLDDTRNIDFWMEFTLTARNQTQQVLTEEEN